MNEPARLTAHASARGGAGRAFTLIELLVVLAVIVMLAGLVVPACLNWIGEHRFRESMTSVEAVIESWRANAQRDGAVLIVGARDGAKGLELVASSPPAAEGENGATEPERRVSSWIAQISSVRVGDAPTGTYSEQGDGDGVDTSSTKAEGGEGVLVCLLLPDGSAAGPRVLSVRDAVGRGAVGRIDRWSGEVHWSRIARDAPNGGQAELSREPEVEP